ncbi:MAG: GAF domain-containing protein [Calditrichaeota bacterium]|nr:MAG: GAF domain-containing protein [Calditrichota bacterium]
MIRHSARPTRHLMHDLLSSTISMLSSDSVLLLHLNGKENHLTCVYCSECAYPKTNCTSSCSVGLNELPAKLQTTLRKPVNPFPVLTYNALPLKGISTTRDDSNKLFYPIKNDLHRIVGFLLFESSDRILEDKARKMLTESVANICSSFLGEAEAKWDAGRTTQKLEVLSRVSDKFLAEPDGISIPKHYDYLGRQTIELLDAEYCSLWFVKNKRATLCAGFTRSGKLTKTISKTVNLDGSSNNLLGTVLRHKKLINAQPYSTDKYGSNNPENPNQYLQSGKIYSAIANPIFGTREQLDGILIAYNKLDSTGKAGKNIYFSKNFDEPLLQIFTSKMQVSLQRSQLIDKLKQHQLIVNSTPDPVIISSKFGKIIYMNPGAQTMFGDLMGKSITQAYYSDDTNSNLDRARDIKDKLHASEDGNISNYETILCNKKGEPVYAALSVSMVSDEFGRFNGSIGIAKDLSKSRALLTIGQALLTSKNSDLLLEQVTAFGLQIPKSTRAYFKLYNEQEQTLEFQALSSKDRTEKCPDIGTPADTGFTGHVFMNQKPCYSGDVHSDPEIKWNAIFPSVRSKIVIPITYHDNETGKSRKLGVYSVDSAEKNAFSQADVSYLETLANQAAVALYNANLLETKNRVIQRLRAAERVQQTTVSSQIDNEVVYESLLDAVTSDLDFQFAWISLIDKKKNTISSVHGRNVDKEFLHLAVHSLDSKDIQAWVVRHGEQFYIDHYDERLDEYIYNKFGHDKYVRLITPLLKGSEIIGTLEVGYSKEFRKVITDDEKRLVEHLTKLTGLSLAHRDLHNKLKDDIKVRLNLQKQLDALNEASIKLLNVATEDEAIDHIFKSLKSVGFDKGMLSLVNKDNQTIEGKLAMGENWKAIQSDSIYPLTGKNICAAILRSKKAEFIANCAKDLRFDKNLVRKAKINSQYVIPLIAKSELIGVLQIDLTDNDEIKNKDKETVQEHMKVLHTFASQSAIAIRNIHGLIAIDRLETTIAETAHEFRNPLHNILTQIGGLKDHLQESYSGNDIDKYIQIIQEEVYRAKRHVDNSLFLTEKTRVGVGCDFQKHYLQDIIQGCVDNYKLRALERGIRIAVRDNIRRLPKIVIDKPKIEQVFNNIIENAVKYSHYRQLINIKGYDSGSQILIAISDRGLGIPPEEREKIFKGFLRSKAKDSIRYISGTGIGLKICKEFIDMHGGEINVESKPMSNSLHKIRDYQDYQTTVNILLPKEQKRSSK